jgi:hypothetical protein
MKTDTPHDLNCLTIAIKLFIRLIFFSGQVELG